MSPIVVYPEYHIPPVPSLITSYGVCGVLPLALASLAALSWTRDRLRARRAKAAVESTAPAPDGRTVVRGTVELAQGAAHAVRVEIDQLGFESCSKGKWSHRWMESDRKTLAQPFYVREPGGRRIRVEAAADVRIVDDLDEVIRVSADRRTRVAAISPGEEVYVFGVLGKGRDPEMTVSYREGGQGPVLRSPDAEHMLIATSPPAAGFRASARIHAIWVAIFLLLASVLQFVHWMHSVRVATGETASATVLATRTYTTKGNKGTIHHHFAVKTRAPDGTVFEEEIEEEDWAKLSEGSAIAIVHVPGKRGYEILGDRPTVHVASALVPLIACVFLFFAYLGHRQAIRPWHERRSIQNDGTGRLADSNDDPSVDPAVARRLK
ncbi:MAG TPA: hypothetical protein PLI95_19770 [Polyangiaceae bacterium]|nr:hypothetical protein [Polyangiaceae bacterium]